MRSEVLLRESRDKRQLLGLAEHLTTDQARGRSAPSAPRRAGGRQQRSGSLFFVAGRPPGPSLLRQRPPLAPLSRQVIAAAWSVMEATIAHVRSFYGDAAGYLRDIGLTQDEVERIRANLAQ